MSTISAGTSTSTALVSSGDTTGNLVLQVNGTTPSLTLNAAGAHGVGSSPSYGTAGQVLTSAGSAASPTWATATSGGMTLLATVAATNGAASVSVTGLASSKQLVIVTTTVVLSSALNLTLNMSADNGSTYGTARTISSTLATARSVTNIYNTNASGVAKSIFGATGSSTIAMTEEAAITGVINALQFSVSGGGTFTSGNFYIYGIN